jgi:hypothetical protein
MDDATIFSQKFTYLTYEQALNKLTSGESLEQCMITEYKNIYISKLLKNTTYTSNEANNMLLKYSYDWCMRIFLHGDTPPEFNLYQHILEHPPFVPLGSHVKKTVLTRKLRKFIHKTQLSEKEAHDILQQLYFNDACKLFNTCNTAEECHVLYVKAKNFMDHTNCSLEQSIHIVKDKLILSEENTLKMLQLPFEQASNIFNTCKTVDDCINQCKNAKILMRQTDYSFIKAIEMLKDNTVEQCISIYLDVPVKVEKPLSTNQGIFKVMRELY